MKVLFFADIFGKPGRRALEAAIKKLTALYEIDFIVVNCENITHGKGMQPKMIEETFALGVDVITSGNHAFDQGDIISVFNSNPKLLRPANYPNHPMYPAPGNGSVVVRSKKNPELTLGVIQVMGRVYMDPIDCPFQSGDTEYEKVKKENPSGILIDFHGEASSEKQAFAYYFDGRASAVVGSHSHVQTADERVLEGGTAAITDVGMTGCFDSVIGNKKELSIQKFLSKRPVRYEPAEGKGGYGAVIIDIDEKNGKSNSILRLRETVIE